MLVDGIRAVIGQKEVVTASPSAQIIRDVWGLSWRPAVSQRIMLCFPIFAWNGSHYYELYWWIWRKYTHPKRESMAPIQQCMFVGTVSQCYGTEFLECVGCKGVADEPLFENSEWIAYWMFNCRIMHCFSILTNREAYSHWRWEIIRYECGYVGMELYKRFEKQQEEKAASLWNVLTGCKPVG